MSEKSILRAVSDQLWDAIRAARAEISPTRISPASCDSPEAFNALFSRLSREGVKFEVVYVDGFEPFADPFNRPPPAAIIEHIDHWPELDAFERLAQRVQQYESLA